MMGIAVKTIARATPDVIAGLAAAGAATVHEAQGRSGSMGPRLTAITPGAAIAGSAVTALCAPGDNWMLHLAIERMGPGDVLVVATTSPSDDGFFGDVLAEFVARRGGAGVVLDTGIRDVAVLRDRRFPAWARAISAQGTVKETLGSVNVPVVCAGVRVVPGDVVVADDDGVVVVPRATAADVLAAARARETKEDAMRARIAAGEGTLDILGLRARMAERGLRDVEGPVDWEGKGL
ncbi:MAG: 4-carboxy-4-hydroxy-2-oxoadipate aldolase/oxaloacetate decarboxylase [Alkalilacustris sp.]